MIESYMSMNYELLLLLLIKVLPWIYCFVILRLSGRLVSLDTDYVIIQLINHMVNPLEARDFIDKVHGVTCS